MECMGINMAEGEWSYLSGIFTNEEADFMAQLLNNCPVPNEFDSSSNYGVPSGFWPGSHESIMNNAVFNGGSCSDFSSFLLPSLSQESYHLSESQPVMVSNDPSMSIDLSMEDATNNNTFLIDADDCLNQELSAANVEEIVGRQPDHCFPDQNLQPRKESEIPAMEPSKDDIKINTQSENPNKRSRARGDVQKNKRNVRAKKTQKAVMTSNINIEDDGNTSLNRQASSSCSSEDDFNNGSQDLNGVSSSVSSQGPAALNSNGKTRASRGSATDPQSLYARKRRERINERLRILQHLVPNGTKVDISTMLEEAVQYVKFLQLQIKMLSSDDLWMYAPLAYNGMNLGLDLKINTPKSS